MRSTHLLDYVRPLFGQATMTLCILAKYRWIMLPNAGRGHMLEDRFGIPQEVLTRTDTMMFLAIWSDPIAERPFPSLAMPESSGVTNLMRIDSTGRRGLSRYEEVSGCRRCRGRRQPDKLRPTMPKPVGRLGRTIWKGASGKRRGTGEVFSIRLLSFGSIHRGPPRDETFGSRTSSSSPICR